MTSNVTHTPLITRHRTSFVGIGLNKAGINCKAIATDQAFRLTALRDSLEEMTQNVALAETAIAVQREG
jgi:hypothetical protein